MTENKFGVDLVKDEGTESIYEQLSLMVEETMFCQRCKRKAKLPTLMRFEDKNYLGHLECMKSLRRDLEGKFK